MLKSQQRDYVRDLGRNVQELASSQEYEARRQRWRDVNALRRPDRSPVWCRPVGCWPELLPEGELQCPDRFYRDIERHLRRCLIKHDIGDDSLVEPYWDVPAAILLDGEHEWGVEIRHIQPDSPGGAWRFDPPVKEEADLSKLNAPRYHHDEAESQRRLEQCSELFEGVMPVRLTAAVLSPSMVGCSRSQTRRPFLMRRAASTMGESELAPVRMRVISRHWASV